MLSQPIMNPGIGPATTPPIITRKAVGLTFGGPHANPMRSAAFAAESVATSARILVLPGMTMTWMVYPARLN
jgi:hypothetical protein